MSQLLFLLAVIVLILCFQRFLSDLAFPSIVLRLASCPAYLVYRVFYYVISLFSKYSLYKFYKHSEIFTTKDALLNGNRYWLSTVRLTGQNPCRLSVPRAFIGGWWNVGLFRNPTNRGARIIINRCK